MPSPGMRRTTPSLRGWFTTAEGNPASRIASWNGSTWSALGAGVDNPVYALAWDAASNTLFAGGTSSQPEATRPAISPAGMVPPGQHWVLV
ncbi:MAG: hypothetical protein H6660_10865 [Ardenticatenaceae bacterium]|nr:hypothetical protein [Ardenticatenaceae bacterium]